MTRSVHRYSFAALLSIGLIAATLSSQRVNLAKLQKVSADSTLSGFDAAYAVDGVVGNDRRWISQSGAGTRWLEIEFPIPIQVGSAHVFMGLNDAFPIANFALEYWTGSAWRQIPGAVVTGNTLTERVLIFSQPIASSRVRLTSTGQIRVKELALYPPQGASSFPLGTDLTVNLAKQRQVSADSFTPGAPPKNALDGYIGDGSRWISANTNGPHWLEVNLYTSSYIGSYHVHSGTGRTAGSMLRDFRLQYWSGGTWVDAPGGSVTGNTQFSRAVILSAPITASRIRLQIQDNGEVRLRELVVLPESRTRLPLGVDALPANPPRERWATYRDAFYSLVNLDGGLALDTTNRTTVQRSSGSFAQQYQILLNVGTDIFRLRNRATGQCLEVVGGSLDLGAPVREATYAALPHQLWRIRTSATAGHVVLQNVWSRFALDVNGSPTSPGNSLVQQTPNGSASQQWRVTKQTHFPKKGIAGWTVFGSRYDVNWAYNWSTSTSTSFDKDTNYFPMVWGNYGWGGLPRAFPRWLRSWKPTILMGFNEPDNSSQSNIPVQTALDLWPRLEQSNLPLVGPGITHPDNAWTRDFYRGADARGLRVDYFSAHWYGSPGNPSGFINWLQNIYRRHGRPIWLTEFSCVDWSGNGNWTWEDNYTWLAEVLWRFESLPWLDRYSLFLFTGSGTAKRSNFFVDSSRALTPFGMLYAGWDQIAEVLPHKSYFIHNKGTHKHVRLFSGAPAPGVVDARTNDNSVQWFLEPTAQADRFYLTALTDGRRLASNGSRVTMAPPGTTADTEWRLTSADHGWYFLDHIASGSRLRQLTTGYQMIRTTDNWDSARFRFITPYRGPAVPRIYGTGCGDARIGWRGSLEPGSTVTTRLSMARPTLPTTLLISANRSALPLDLLGMPGCSLNLDLNGAVSIATNVNALGNAQIALPIPSTFRGNLITQFAFVQPGLNSLGIGTTRGLDLPFR